MNPRALDLAATLARMIVGVVFLAAAWPKLIDPVAFAEDIRNYQAFPWWSDQLLAGWVPVLELIAGLGFAIGLRRRACGWALAALNLGFLLLIGSVIARGIDLNCGCFGRSEEASAVGWPLFVRDLALMVAIGLGMWREGVSFDAWWARRGGS